MRRAERLFRIIQLLRESGRAMTAAEIAEPLEVSPRTIYRDMAHLVGSGAPIDGEPGVGYLLREAFDAPPLTFTFEQLEALAFGAQAVRQLADPGLAAAAREALAKIEDNLSPEHARRLRDTPIFAARGRALPAPPKYLRLLRRAMAEHRKVEIDYLSLGDARSRRVVRPLGLVNFGPVWLLTSWCELRGDFRDFRVDRVGHATLLKLRFKDEAGKMLSDCLARRSCATESAPRGKAAAED